MPGRALGAAVERLKDCLPEEAYALLSDLHAAVVQQLRAQGGEAGGEEGDQRLEQLVAAARGLVGRGGSAGGEA